MLHYGRNCCTSACFASGLRDCTNRMNAFQSLEDVSSVRYTHSTTAISIWEGTPANKRPSVSRRSTRTQQIRSFSKAKSLSAIFVQKMQYSPRNYDVIVYSLCFLARQKYFPKAVREKQLKIKFCIYKAESTQQRPTLTEEIKDDRCIRHLHQQGKPGTSFTEKMLRFYLLPCS